MIRLATTSTVKYDDMKRWVKHFEETGHTVLSVSVFAWEGELFATILHK